MLSLCVLKDIHNHLGANSKGLHDFPVLHEIIAYRDIEAESAMDGDNALIALELSYDLQRLQTIAEHAPSSRKASESYVKVLHLP